MNLFRKWVGRLRRWRSWWRGSRCGRSACLRRFIMSVMMMMMLSTPIVVTTFVIIISIMARGTHTFSGRLFASVWCRRLLGAAGTGILFIYFRVLAFGTLQRPMETSEWHLTTPALYSHSIELFIVKGTSFKMINYTEIPAYFLIGGGRRWGRVGLRHQTDYDDQDNSNN